VRTFEQLIILGNNVIGMSKSKHCRQRQALTMWRYAVLRQPGLLLGKDNKA
jgi:hypothetical protein